MTNPARASNAGVKFPPPFLFLLGLGLAWLLETRVTRIHLVGATAAPEAMNLVGVALLIAGFVMMFWGLFTFARARTAIIPHKPATQLVQHGPYRFSRNPMYTGMATAYLGGALVMNSGWALITLPFIMLVLYHLVIRREEAYLSSAFPEEYSTYRSRVRRFL